MMILGFVLLAGCNEQLAGKSSPDPKITHEFTEAMRKNFSGVYRSSCQETYYKGQRLYETEEVSFGEAASYQRISAFYLDGACQILAAELKEDGTFELYTYQDVGGQHIGVGVTRTYSYLKPDSEQFAHLLISENFCGRNDWREGTWSSTSPVVDEMPEDLAPETDSADVLIETECAIRKTNDCFRVRLTKFGVVGE
jgi:hypothetical protein